MVEAARGAAGTNVIVDVFASYDSVPATLVGGTGREGEVGSRHGGWVERLAEGGGHSVLVPTPVANWAGLRETMVGAVTSGAAASV